MPPLGLPVPSASPLPGTRAIQKVLSVTTVPNSWLGSRVCQAGSMMGGMACAHLPAALPAVQARSETSLGPRSGTLPWTPHSPPLRQQEQQRRRRPSRWATQQPLRPPRRWRGDCRECDALLCHCRGFCWRRAPLMSWRRAPACVPSRQASRRRLPHSPCLGWPTAARLASPRPSCWRALPAVLVATVVAAAAGRVGATPQLPPGPPPGADLLREVASVASVYLMCHVSDDVGEPVCPAPRPQCAHL